MDILMTLLYLMLGFQAVNSDDVEAQLHAYSYKGTQCTRGLMVGMPLYLDGIVRLPGDIKEDGNYISIERKVLNMTEFEQFGVIFNKCEVSEEFFCKPLDNTNVYAFYIHAKATLDLSESKWKFNGKYRKKDFESEVITLPKIYNITDVKMTVNGLEWSLGNTSLTVTTDQLTICCIPDGAPWPCEAVISVNSEAPVTDSPCVTQKLETSAGRKLAEVKFGFRVCGTDTFSQIYSPDVIVEARSVSGIVSYIETWTISGIFGALVVIVIVILFVVYIIKDCFGQTNQVTESSSRPLLPQQSQAGNSSTTLTIQQDSYNKAGKSKMKGKKNKGKKPSEVTAPETTSNPATTRGRTLSDSETTRRRNVVDQTSTRKMKTK